MVAVSAKVKKANFFLNQCAMQKQWHLGYAFISSSDVNLSEIKDSWLVKHISYIVDNHEEYIKYVEVSALKDRLLSLVEYEDYVGVRIICGGKINAIIFVHELRKGGEKLEIVEKVYPGYKREAIKKESELFENYASHELFSPEFYGVKESNFFLSTYYEFVKGEKVSEEAFPEIKMDLIVKLWSTSKKYFNGGKFVDGYDYSLHEVDALRFLDVIKAAASREGVDEVAFCRALQYFPDLLGRAVYNLDLHSNNVIKSSGGKFFIVDWDKYSLVSVPSTVSAYFSDSGSVFKVLNSIKSNHKDDFYIFYFSILRECLGSEAGVPEDVVFKMVKDICGNVDFKEFLDKV